METGYRALAALTPLDAWAHFQELQRNQWLSAEELAAIRWRKLRRLLVFAAEHVPYYRRTWRELGVDPREFASEQDLVNLPVVTRAELNTARATGEFALGNTGYELVRTSGTTGESFQVAFTRDDFQKKYAAHLRQFYASGWRLGMRSATLYHSGHPRFGGRHTGQAERDSFLNYRRLALRLAHRRRWLPPYSAPRSGDDAFPRRWYAELTRYRPVLLETLEFNLPVLVDYVQRAGLEPPRIPVIYLLGTFSEQARRRYAAFFSGDVYNRYAPHEVEGVAFACDRHEGMHVSVDAFHVEFLDGDDRPVAADSPGLITITDLDNYTMPLIRYRVGDLGRSLGHACACGRGLPLMGDIDGRAGDAIVLAEGRRLVPGEVARPLQDTDGVGLFQVLQSPDGGIGVDIVPAPGADPVATRERAHAAVQALAGPRTRVAARCVDSIALEPNGKLRSVRGARHA